MNKFINLLALLSLSSTQLFAEESESAYNLCSSMSFSSDKLACMNVVKDSYFLEDAVKVCAGLSFSSEKIDCLKVIANKNFSKSALAICRQLSFSSEKLKCLSQSASEIDSCVKLEEVEAKVYQALGELRRNRHSRAETTLENLLDRIQNCGR